MRSASTAMMRHRPCHQDQVRLSARSVLPPAARDPCGLGPVPASAPRASRGIGPGCGAWTRLSVASPPLAVGCDGADVRKAKPVLPALAGVDPASGPHAPRRRDRVVSCGGPLSNRLLGHCPTRRRCTHAPAFVRDPRLQVVTARAEQLAAQKTRRTRADRLGGWCVHATAVRAAHSSRQAHGRGL